MYFALPLVPLEGPGRDGAGSADDSSVSARGRLGEVASDRVGMLSLAASRDEGELGERVWSPSSGEGVVSAAGRPVGGVGIELRLVMCELQTFPAAVAGSGRANVLLRQIVQVRGGTIVRARLEGDGWRWKGTRPPDGERCMADADKSARSACSRGRLLLPSPTSMVVEEAVDRRKSRNFLVARPTAA